MMRTAIARDAAFIHVVLLMWWRHCCVLMQGGAGQRVVMRCALAAL